MPKYMDQGKKKTLPSRKARKGLRNTSFINNKLAFRKLRSEREERLSEPNETGQS